MSQAKEKAQALNTKITKKSAAAKKTTKAAAPSPTDDLSEKLSNCIVTDGDNCDLFSSCEELVHEKLEKILSNLKCKSSSSKTADEVRKKVHEEKCVSEESLQNIKLFFADVKNCKDDEGVSASRYCVVASKYLRIFIDILEVTAFDEVDFVLQACDLVITVHQYFFMKGKLEDCFEKLIPMLHHIIKQLYKKQSIPCIVTIIKNITNLLHIASKKKEAELADESKRSFTLIHQMCYSLYFKELQILIKNQNKQTDITSNVDLRINSLIILAFSNWNENKFIEHLSNFISNESVILMKSCTYNEQVLSESLQNLLKNLYRLIDLELKNEKPVLVKSLLIFTWKLGHMYTNFCMFNRLHSELITFLDFVPINLKTKFECLKKGADLLKETASICGLIIQNKCTCKGKNLELNGYVKLVLTYYASYSTGNTADVSRLFDILNSWKLQLKDGNQLCGCFVNVLLEMVLFLSEELIKVHQTERLKQMLVMLSFVRGLMMQIQMHLFPDSKNTLQCYTNEEIRAVFINTFNNLVTSLQSSLTSLRTDIKYDDIKWLAVVYKIGGLYYNQRQYKIAVPSLKFSIFLSDWACENNGASETNVKEGSVFSVLSSRKWIECDVYSTLASRMDSYMFF